MKALICTLALTLISCGRYSPGEVIDTYNTWEQGVQEIDTTPLGTWAQESGTAATGLTESVAQLVDTVQSINSAVEYINQDEINDMILYWANNTDDLGEWAQNFPSML